MHTDQHGLDALSERIIGCAFRVAISLGAGFLEKVDENALAIALRRSGITVEQQKALEVRYEVQVFGEYVADLLVEGVVLVELKAVRELDSIHMAQCLNYLKAAHLNLCLLLDFGRPRVQVRRIRND